MRIRKHLALGLLILACLCVSSTKATAQNLPKGELFVGFSGRTNGDPVLKGWNVSGAVHINAQLEIVADFSGHYWSSSRTEDISSRSGIIPSNGSSETISISSNVSSSTDTYSLVAGPQFSHHLTGRARIFVHVLFGASRVHVRNNIVLNVTPQLSAANIYFDPSAFCLYCRSSVTQWGFTFGAGGGLDVTIAKHWAVRVLQADYLNKPNVLGQGSNDFRLSSGLLYQW